LGYQGFFANNTSVTAGLRLTTFLVALCSYIPAAQAEQPRVTISTNLGDIIIELSANEAPVGVANFLKHVDEGSYVGTIFHRVIPDFIVQAGGHLEDLSEVDKGDMILNEADNGLFNKVGTIAYARNDEIDSAARQFFINVSDNASLDHSANSCSREQEESRLRALERGLNKPQTCGTFGYAVFGHVVAGMAVVSKIADVPTGFQGDMADVPDTPIIINSMTRLQTAVVDEK
jgi:peptidyl-prolyl cis-trans isomerase A (cyclophilin A)